MKADMLWQIPCAVIVGIFGLLYFILWAIWELRKPIIIIVAVCCTALLLWHNIDILLSAQYLPLFIGTVLVLCLVIGLLLCYLQSDISRHLRKQIDMEADMKLNQLNRKEN